MTFNFRNLRKEDFPLFACWLDKPHVNKWWREPATVEHVSKQYGACTRGDYKTRVFVAEIETKPIGIIQVFKLSDYTEYEGYFPLKGAVSIDYLIGEEEFIGKGYGSKMIREFTEKKVKQLYPDATGISTSAEIENLPSLGALKNSDFVAGNIFEGEDGPEQIMTLKF